MAQKDVSRQTIVVLVFVTILVALLGTLITLNEISSLEQGYDAQAQQNSETKATGTISLNIGESPKPLHDAATGMVSLNILRGA